MHQLLWGKLVSPLRRHQGRAWQKLSLSRAIVLASVLLDTGVLEYLAELADPDGQVDIEAEDDQVLLYVLEARLLLEEAASELLEDELFGKLAEIDARYAPFGAGLAHLPSHDGWDETTGGSAPYPGFLAGWAAAREESFREAAEAHRRLVACGSGLFPAGFSLEEGA